MKTAQNGTLGVREIGSTLALVLSLGGLAACGSSATGPTAPRDVVRSRLEELAPAANLGHRGAGVTTPESAHPENSLPSFREAIAQGADGVELDVELTADGALVVMHDDTLDRTTTCAGCVSERTLADVRTCRLLDGAGQPTAEAPPTLSEVYDALPSDALVNVELKAYGSRCLTASTGPATLARTAVAEIRSLGVEDRTLFSSFDDVAAATVRAEGNSYSALLLTVTDSITWTDGLALARELDQDAIHPFFVIPPEGVRAARDDGLQVNVWTVDRPSDMNASLDAGATSIITDVPGVLAGVLASRGEASSR